MCSPLGSIVRTLHLPKLQSADLYVIKKYAPYKLFSFLKNLLNRIFKTNEPRREKTGFLHMRKTKAQISFAVTVKLISTFVFTTQMVQSLYFLNPKFQASRHLLWLYSPVCVGPGRKPRRPFFSRRGSNRG